MFCMYRRPWYASRLYWNITWCSSWSTESYPWSYPSVNKIFRKLLWPPAAPLATRPNAARFREVKILAPGAAVKTLDLLHPVFGLNLRNSTMTSSPESPSSSDDFGFNIARQLLDLTSPQVMGSVAVTWPVPERELSQFQSRDYIEELIFSPLSNNLLQNAFSKPFPYPRR